MEAMPVHSQYTSTVRVKVSDPTTLLTVIWYSPLSSRVTSAVVKVVVVTVTLVSVTSAPFNVTLSIVRRKLPSSERGNVNWSPSVDVAVAVEGEN